MAIVGLFGLLATSAFAQPAALDGLSFSIQTADSAGEEGPDTLLFVDGTFESTDCRQWGFTAAPYTATDADGTVSFSAEAASESEGTASWTGTITGDQISGTMVWSKEGQEPITYTFSGAAAAPAAE